MRLCNERQREEYQKQIRQLKVRRKTKLDEM